MLQNARSLFTRIRHSTPSASAPALARGPAQKTEPGPINVLPPELLDDVFDLLDRNTLLTCMQVCKRWYGIASFHFFAVIPATHRHLIRFSKHLRTHPDLGKHVRDVSFFDRSCGDFGRHRSAPRGPFDIQLLASTLPVLTNLRKLHLVGYDVVLGSSLQSRSPIGHQPARAPLQLLSFDHCKDAASMLPALLSLFSVNTLVINVYLPGSLHPLEGPTRVPSQTRASISIQNLVLGESAQHFEDLYTFFERALVPGSLRGLGTGLWNHRDLPILERFLGSSAGRDLVSISIGAVFGAYTPPVLGAALAHCTQLQYLRLGFFHEDEARVDPLSQPDAFLPILTNLPATLRALALHIWLDTPALWCCISTTIGLDAADRMLAPGAPSRGGGEGGGGREGQFPDLRRVELHVHQNTSTPRVCRRTCMHPLGGHDPGVPLPRLQAAGLLRYRAGDVELDQPHANLYWPPDT